MLHRNTTAGTKKIIIQMQQQHNDPLHGLTLERIVTQLQEHYGWQELGERITINCFTNNPGMKSSLTFLRKTPWARKKVEQLYIRTFSER